MNQVVLLASIMACLAVAPPGYSPLGQSKQVAVFRNPSGPGVALYAEGPLNGSPEQVRDVLLAYERHPTFIRHVVESRILRREDNTLWVYQRLKFPVLADRDFTLKVTTGSSADGLWLRFACDNAQGPPPRRGVVRLTTHQGGWLLKPLPGARTTQGHYQLRIDLGGSLPGWIVRGKAGKEVPALFEQLRRQVR